MDTSVVLHGNVTWDKKVYCNSETGTAFLPLLIVTALIFIADNVSSLLYMDLSPS